MSLMTFFYTVRLIVDYPSSNNLEFREIDDVLDDDVEDMFLVGARYFYLVDILTMTETDLNRERSSDVIHRYGLVRDLSISRSSRICVSTAFLRLSSDKETPNRGDYRNSVSNTAKVMFVNL